MSKKDLKNNNNSVVTKKDLRICALRWLLGSATYNYSTQMATTVVFAEMKALRKIYKDDEEYYQSLKNAFKYFNITPPVAGFLLGSGIAMEEKEGVQALDAVTNLKVSLMGPMSGIGDMIIWSLIPTVFGSIAAYMGMEGNPIGVILFMAFDIFMWIWKIFYWEYGYKFGTSMINTLHGKINYFTEAASVLGLTIVGALIPSVVKVSTPLNFVMNDVVFNVQTGILDVILPSLLSVLVTFVVYKLVKKKVSIIKIILGMVVLSLVCAAFGILG